jgi:putative endonuclease
MKGSAVHIMKRRPRACFVYLLLCEDGSYYTGSTNNLASRLKKHKAGYGARYTRMRRPKKVVHVEEFRTRRAAMKREREIKRLTRDQKHRLVTGNDTRRSTLER